MINKLEDFVVSNDLSLWQNISGTLRNLVNHLSVQENQILAPSEMRAFAQVRRGRIFRQGNRNADLLTHPL